jgi:hypothetical protein
MHDKKNSPKIDGLYKHSSKKKDLVNTPGQPRGTIYLESNNIHSKNDFFFSFQSQLVNVFQQVCVGIEGEEKCTKPQFASCFHVLNQSWPMIKT